MYTGQHYLMSNLESLQHYLQVFGSASFPHHLILKLKEHPHHHFESYGLVHLYWWSNLIKYSMIISSHLICYMQTIYMMLNLQTNLRNSTIKWHNWHKTALLDIASSPPLRLLDIICWSPLILIWLQLNFHLPNLSRRVISWIYFLWSIVWLLPPLSPWWAFSFPHC